MTYEEKLDIIRTCLTARFEDVRDREDLNRGQLFVFHNGRHSWQLNFDRFYIEEFPYPDQLSALIENRIVPEIQANLGMRLEVGRDGSITTVIKNP